MKSEANDTGKTEEKMESRINFGLKRSMHHKLKAHAENNKTRVSDMIRTALKKTYGIS